MKDRGVNPSYLERSYSECRQGVLSSAKLKRHARATKRNRSFESRHSRMDQVKFMEDSL